MGQVLHGSARTTHAIRAELQRSKASVATLAQRYGINEKTVIEWRSRQSVEDLPMGQKERRGARRVDGHQVISGIIHMLKTGARRRDCPPDYGLYTTIYNRFNR